MGPKPHLHLPYIDWPAADRLLWQQAICDDDPFTGVHLAKASEGSMHVVVAALPGVPRQERAGGIGRISCRPTHDHARQTLGQARRETNAPNSVATLVEGLYTTARVMMPDRHWSWLKAIKARLHAAAPGRSPAGPVITSVQLLELALKLMDENKP
jgi:hypothetical protein